MKNSSWKSYVVRYSDEYTTKTLEYKVGDRWVNEQVIIAFNELDGVDLLDNEFKKLIESGEETRKSLSQIEELRYYFNNNAIKFINND